MVHCGAKEKSGAVINPCGLFMKLGDILGLGFGEFFDAPDFGHHALLLVDSIFVGGSLCLAGFGFLLTQGCHTSTTNQWRV
jgi:hypothetical protein